MDIPHITNQHIRKHIRLSDVVGALETALQTEVDPSQDFPRSFYQLDDERRMLFMASQTHGWVGAKIMSVNDRNPARNVDRAQGLYVLMDAETTTPRAIIDGDDLTDLRTAAMTSLVTSRFVNRDSRNVVMYGYGAQARKHAEVLRQLHPQLKQLVIAGRNASKVEMFAATAAELGWNARIGQAMPPTTAIPQADLIITATGSGEPLFDGSLVRPGALVIALGSHTDTRSELDTALIARSNVIVEDIDTAINESGEIAIALAEGAITRDDLIPVRDVVRGDVRIDRSRPTVYKTVGMPWQDLAVASEIFQRLPSTALR
ncbi:ornithine cyclodeaminase family protein [Gulosibacter faecalis]|uniref:Ornithine cyclodeaminase family protein n=1 Tax=Gulosibacter faecalis TaxID=272240 RepID=A0ABW5UWQ2_9MICO|nr:ornithine cyclodeaminase family protein [Gulosibacter faecalis]